MHKEDLEPSKASGRQCLGEHIAEVLVFIGPWDTSFKISKAASVQESAEEDSATEPMWRSGENLLKHAGFTRLKNNTMKSSGNNHYAWAQEKVEALSFSVEPQHKKRRF